MNNTSSTEEALVRTEEINIKTNVAKNDSIIKNYIYKFIKRFFDIIAGIVGIIILIPLIILVYVLRIINKENDGPIFYEHLRIGFKGKKFRMYKFRSMIIGADQKLKDYLEDHPEEAKYYKKFKKLKNDPRITKTGKFLRSTSLDEWPQFINLICGSMTLVGPRPYLPYEKNDMGEYYNTIIKVKPGITGPWQISGRSNVTFEDRLKMDKEYCDNHNLLTDMMIIFKTIKKVLMKDGAL